jgi:hypothetical protein
MKKLTKKQLKDLSNYASDIRYLNTNNLISCESEKTRLEEIERTLAVLGYMVIIDKFGVHEV